MSWIFGKPKQFAVGSSSIASNLHNVITLKCCSNMTNNMMMIIVIIFNYFLILLISDEIQGVFLAHPESIKYKKVNLGLVRCSQVPRSNLRFQVSRGT